MLPAPTMRWRPNLPQRALRRAARTALSAFLLAVTAGLAPAQLPTPLPTPQPPTADGVNVLTQRYNNQRTGHNPQEALLTPARVAGTDGAEARRFGKLYSRTVDGAVLGQPLYVSGLVLNNRATGRVEAVNAVFVATSRNTIYAFNADTNEGRNNSAIWQLTFSFPFLNILPLPADDIYPGYEEFGPEIGIVSTPVIDRATNTLYAVTRTRQFSRTRTELRAIDIATGTELPNSPVEIVATVPGNGDNSVDGMIGLDPVLNNQQAGLLLQGGKIYIAFGSHDDTPFYHGFVVAYDARTLQQTAAFSPAPDSLSDLNSPTGAGAGITQSGTGIAADAAGNLYVATGNGLSDSDVGGTSYGQSVLRLSAAGGGLAVADYFTPFNFDLLSQSGAELTTGGVVVIPDNPGGRSLAVAGGREGIIYLLDRANLGGLGVGVDNVVQSVQDSFGGQYGAPAYFNRTLYFQGSGEVLRGYRFTDDGLLDTASPLQGTRTHEFPGAAPVVSSNGANGGVVWTLGPAPVSGSAQPVATLRAYNAATLGAPLYDSAAVGPAEGGGAYLPFTVPTVANGRVYVPARNQLTVYGLTAARPVTAAYYILSGPVIPGPVFPSIKANQVTDFSLTAVGPDGQPIKLNTTVRLSIDEGGTVRGLGTLRFRNESNITFRQAFQFAGAYVLFVNDERGGSTARAYLDTFGLPGPLVFVDLPATQGLDRFSVRAKSTAYDGETITVNIQALSSRGTPVRLIDYLQADIPGPPVIPAGTPIPHTAFLYDTNPNATTPFDAFNGIDFVDFFFETSRTVTRTLNGVGRHVLIVTDGNATGTVVVNVIARR